MVAPIIVFVISPGLDCRYAGNGANALRNRVNRIRPAECKRVDTGEDTDMYENGKVVSHEGAWLSGGKGARFGIMMPGVNLLGARYFQEVAPDVALDKAETVDINGAVDTPACEFKNVLKTLETMSLEPNVEETKYYAPGIGLVKDSGLELVRHGFR